MNQWLDLLKSDISADYVEKVGKELADGRCVADYLIDNKIVTKKKLLSALSRHFNLPSVDLDQYEPDPHTVAIVSESIARRFMIVPLFDVDDTLYIATTNPVNFVSQDYVSKTTGLHVESVLAVEGALIALLNRLYLTREKTAEAMGTYTEKEQRDIFPGEIELGAEDVDAPAIKLVNYILRQAINLESSDIHLEPFPTHILLRYRVDGILHEFPPPPLHIYRALVSRIKIISNLDVAERRLPQDGRSTFTAGDKEFDLRISIIPNVHGEGVVIRILDTHGARKDLRDLGFSPGMFEQYERAIRTSYGILLVTGPTGSGKTSTLYATLRHIFTLERKVITIEDPVEYQLDGITQIQVNSDIGFNFAAGLRAILRHDPDTIMVGEIRDVETAEIAIRSSLTGHLVFSTLHTNDSVSAITRLVDMGLPQFLVFASLIGILAQRLVRLLCPKCKVEAPVDRLKLLSYGIPEIPPEGRIYGPKGCAACGKLGYKGRTAIFEFLEITEEMKQISNERVAPETLKAMAFKNGFVTLRESAGEKLFSGLTSLQDLLNYTVRGKEGVPVIAELHTQRA